MCSFMRPSPLRHKLAVLRTTLGLTQKEMAALIGCSTPTIQAIELGKLKLSEGLAEKIAFQTGVGLFWLLEDGQSPTPVDTILDPINRDTFEKTQAELRRSQTTKDDLHRLKEAFDEAINLCGLTLYNAYQQGHVDLGIYRLLSALKKTSNLHPEEAPVTEDFMFRLHDKQARPKQPLRPHKAVNNWYQLFDQTAEEHRKSAKPSAPKRKR